MVACFLLPPLLLLLLSGLSQAALQNITVDDTFGDSSGFSLFTLLPDEGSWNAKGDPYAAVPDTERCVEKTWQGASVDFGDTAVGYNLTFYGELFP